MGHVNSGRGMEFGSVEKAIKGFLVFFAQTFSKLFPPSMFRFQNKTERHDCSAHTSSKTLLGAIFILKTKEFAEYSSFDDVSRIFSAIPFPSR
jgi:hypothetical protein